MKKKTVKKYQSAGETNSTKPGNAVAEIITAAKGDPKERSTRLALKQQGKTARAAIRQEAKTERQKAKLERQMGMAKIASGMYKKGGATKSKSKKK